MRKAYGRSNRRSVLTAAALLFIFFYLYIHQVPTEQQGSGPPRPLVPPDNLGEPLACRDLPGANDTLVVMKTGSTEIKDKLPIHISTTLRCYPNHLIFSDLEETFLGEQVIDALEDADPELKEQHEDFQLYRQLKQHGRKALKPSDLSGPVSRPQGNGGKPSNPGWKLDKYKFLPMMQRTLKEYPDKKWYIFVETDTYIFWKTLLAYLAALDWSRPYYLGGQINIGDITFAHGGAGYVVSRPALQMVVIQYLDNKQYWEEFTRNHWAGDCVLGKAFKDAGAPITYAWPIMQSDDIGDMNYERSSEGHRLWCHPTVSYHHLSPAVVRDMWNFEQAWLSEAGRESSDFLRHKDVFAQYILPRVNRSREDWDNHCDEDQGPVQTLDDCRQICENDDKCLQYVLDRDSRCFTTSRPNLGEYARGMDSGWMYERMQAFYDNAEPCGDELWLS